MLDYPEQLKMLRQLTDISLLQDNWDGDGAKHFDKEVIKRCYKLIDLVPYPMDIIPVANNSIQFETERKDYYIKFNVFVDHISAFKVDTKADWYSKYPDINTSALIKLLEGYIVGWRLEDTLEKSRERRKNKKIYKY